MKKHRIKGIVAIIGTLALGGCNGGSGSGGEQQNGGNTPYTPSSTTISVPLSFQVATPVSVYAKHNDALSLSAVNVSDSTSCLSIVSTNNKPFETSYSSSDWWSTAKLSFSIKNTCNSSVALNNVKVNIDGFKVNGQVVTQYGDITQEGEGPYVSAKASGTSVVINGPDCSGQWCDWANLGAGKVKKFTINTSLGKAITSLNVASVSLDSVSPTPEPTPDPAPVIKTGEFTLTIDASQLRNACSSTKCSATIAIGTPSGQSDLEKITFNPAETPVLIKTYTNLLPGAYSVQVDNGALPSGTTFDYGTGSGSINVVADSKSSAALNFKYSEPVATSNVVFSLAGISDLSKFAGISSIEAVVTSQTSGKVYRISIPLSGSVNLNGLPANDTYTISTQSLANPQENIFYKGISLNGVKFGTGSVNNVVNLAKIDTNINKPHVLTFNINGLDSGVSVPLALADNGDTNPDFYVYTKSSVTNGSKLYVLDSTISLDVTTPTGYSIGAYEKVINNLTDSRTITLNFTKVQPLPNNKINATYWALWGNNTSYNLSGGSYPSVPVDAPNIDMSYNVIISSFIVTNSKGEYVLATNDPGKETSPHYYNDQQIIDQINQVKAQKRKIIVSLGGEHFTLQMKTPADKANFVTQVEKIIDKYGFEGIDLDLEAGAVTQDPQLLASAVLEVVNHYRAQGQDFWLTMAPEWLYVVPARWGCGQWGSGDYNKPFYIDLIKALGVDNINYIWPQTYNQGGGNGVCDNNQTKITPANGMDKFVAAMTWAATTESGFKVNTNGVNGPLMPIIPANKFVLGVPATIGAAGGEMLYVMTPSLIASSWSIMQNNYGITAGGFMNWAADWDATPYLNSSYSFSHGAWETGRAISQVINK